MAKIALAVHGGAGTILKSQMTPELEREYRGGLEAGLKAGWDVLEKGGRSLDAVEAAVVSLEDFPLFNAGRGSVFTHKGKQEMDACIMDGVRLKAGAVAFVRNIRNPIKLARLVMEKTEHVLLAGDGAIQFAEERNVEFADDSYFYTENRWKQLEEAIAAGQITLDHTVPKAAPALKSDNLDQSQHACLYNDDQMVENRQNGLDDALMDSRPKGTVGAVACDANGHLAAATSTGGMTNKKFGRVGDTPIIGSGNYADNLCAVSCTGHGEFFMLGVTAFDVAARMKYKGLGLEEAARETIEHLTSIGGEGGLIAVDTLGNVVLPFNSEGMYRGYVSGNGQFLTDIYKLDTKAEPPA